MDTVRRRGVRLVAAAVAVFAAGAGVAYATTLVTATTTEVVQACQKRSSGQLRVVAAADECGPSEVPLSWNVQGPPGEPGPPGEFTGRFASPDGRFAIDVANTGITLGGPAGSITLGEDGIAATGRTVTLSGEDGLTILSQRGDVSVRAGNALLLEGFDLLRALAGDGSVRLGRDGTITIKGKDIVIEADGDLVLKGSKIQQN